ncbi:predicted mitochondrial carrier protein [Moesziomyces antarcticus T-34]|uniref:Predicted mitochondrial carrier protein n=1 Tax=Pseudozyma antarctica (strain T-34) TaxID=1151754 RepID=M9LM18_PSEA3|nr:predicted mitochondrial carrier protein [Moesziomyces antarcticus T-34]
MTPAGVNSSQAANTAAPSSSRPAATDAEPPETRGPSASSSAASGSSKPVAASAAAKASSDAPSRLGSNFWSSWISPSSSSAVAASSAMEKRSKPRRPSFEEFRAEEPPQARLIRLRGLFDTLLDEDDEQALAGGRAREEWMKSARRARYGAGGSLARGSLAPSDIRNSTVGFEACTMSEHAESSSSSSSPSASTSSTSTPSASAKSPTADSKLPSPPPPPRQSYAKELLNQCRQCREDLEAQRARLAEEQAKRASDPGWTSSWGLPTWLGGTDPANQDADASPKGTLANVKDKILSTSVTSTTQQDSSQRPSSTSLATSLGSYLGYGGDSSSKDAKSAEFGHNPPDMEHEAGWTGSGVWGLSAVGHKKRAADRDRDEKVRRGQKVDDDGGARQRQIEWEGFLAYAENKERELYKLFVEMDKNCDMKLDVQEIRGALDRAGIDVPQISLDDFIASLTSTRPSAHASGEKTYVSFPEFRDYLLLLPRKPSVSEIFRFYQVRKAFGLFGMGGIFAELAVGWGKTERGAAVVNFDGDVSLAGEEKKRESPAVKEAKRAEKIGKRQEAAAAAASKAVEASAEDGTTASPATSSSTDDVEGTKEKAAQEAAAAAKAASEEELAEEEEEDDNDMIQGAVALKFLVAGGIAGAVSRTATAPFDRLKIYLITTARAPDVAEAAKAAASGQAGANGAAAKAAGQGLGILREALGNLYRDGGGLRAFWVGNGLNCLKIFPESAIKFLSYETAKRAFAKYVDHVSDSRDISGTSRFLSGGIGGITSQLAIYPVETLKTRLMSSQNAKTSLQGNALLVKTARDMWQAGGMRTYYRGLTAGLIGVFPYSAIDMSTFEGIKLFYIKYTGKEEPGVLALLSFGSVSGSVGATTVYPLNLIRTRLQAAGTPAHPATYDGFWDAAKKTYVREGFVGFYRGLVPTLAKVVPAVSISYVVYEQSKKRLGVQ